MAPRPLFIQCRTGYLPSRYMAENKWNSCGRSAPCGALFRLACTTFHDTPPMPFLTA